ncbi:hypothetical protein ACO0LF_00095 [Undibacterium sp. Di27W]|uniref:hypothetical protein n=1 Tax=Undibacterium sp. Di27W TaxID=3413036 RepID=UPI003BEF8C23
MNIKIMLTALLAMTVSACAVGNRYYLGVAETDSPQKMANIKFSHALKVTEIDNKAFLQNSGAANSTLHQVFLPEGIHKFAFRYNSGVSYSYADAVLTRHLEAGKSYAIMMSAPIENKTVAGSDRKIAFKIEEVDKP